MATLKIASEHIKFENRGQAQDFLRGVIERIGAGFNEGDDWEFTQGTEPTKKRKSPITSRVAEKKAELPKEEEEEKKDDNEDDDDEIDLGE